VRRAAVAHALTAHWLASGLPLEQPARELHRAAHLALTTPARPELQAVREGLENDLSRALHRALSGPLPADPEFDRLLADVDGAAVRVGFARQFHNDAVRDTRSLRARRVPRLLRLGAGEPLPLYFEIDDAVLPLPVPRAVER
jgi:hypothetical protein